jgi:hypothetical protein
VSGGLRLPEARKPGLERRRPARSRDGLRHLLYAFMPDAPVRSTRRCPAQQHVESP